MLAKNVLTFRSALVLSLLWLLSGCRPYYTQEDFAKVKKIDTHVHLNSASNAMGKLAEEDNFRLVTVNVDAPRMSLHQQMSYALQQKANFPKDISFLASFSIPEGQPAGWQDLVIKQLDSAFNNGALGIKVWKNIGMVYRDTANRFIMIDDPMFDPIIKFVIGRDKMVLGHIGEPKNCWLPLDQMTVNNDRTYFERHPEYHMFRHPEYPSYEDQINARDRFLEKHPDLRFVGAHLGSLEWSVDELARRLDKFPKMAVDMAARIGHFQVQSQHDREKVRNFIIKYADRLIYATDGGLSPDVDPDKSKQGQHDAWVRDWTYFATSEMLTVPEVNGSFKGLQLPKDVINKIYYENALKWFGIEN
ncbi:amidohydrolase family protein [Chryseolinea sp. T2]|uniref:amidohydrolase family protein n=1 Tax=Chryseolinea sp. T2 TaxID=3129255 RepID=UPI0030784B75